MDDVISLLQARIAELEAERNFSPYVMDVEWHRRIQEPEIDPAEAELGVIPELTVPVPNERPQDWI